MWKDTYAEHMLVWEELADLDHPGSSMRELRIELGWIRAELANRTGVPQADISRIENGHLDARWSTLQRLLAALAGAGAPQPRERTTGHGDPETVQEVEATGVCRSDPSLQEVILREATEEDARALDSFDSGSGAPWLDEVVEIVDGLLAWRDDPTQVDFDRQVIDRPHAFGTETIGPAQHRQMILAESSAEVVGCDDTVGALVRMRNKLRSRVTCSLAAMQEAGRVAEIALEPISPHSPRRLERCISSPVVPRRRRSRRAGSNHRPPVKHAAHDLTSDLYVRSCSSAPASSADEQGCAQNARQCSP